MEIVNALSAFGAFVVAVIGVWIAVAQLQTGRREAHAARMAEMAWQVYQAYTDPRIRQARGAVEVIMTTPPVPTTSTEYGEKYGEKERQLSEQEDIDTNVRRLLRFYNQVGVLVEKGLVDDDFVFALIGPGIKAGWPVIKAAVTWYQDYEGDLIERQKGDPLLRPVHMYVPKLYMRYLKWERNVEQTMLPIDTL